MNDIKNRILLFIAILTIRNVRFRILNDTLWVAVLGGDDIIIETIVEFV